jgi:hypothetical protein
LTDCINKQTICELGYPHAVEESVELLVQALTEYRIQPVVFPVHFLIYKPYTGTRVVDQDPDWIRIQRLLWIRISIGNPDPDPGARKLRNFSGKNALFSYF